MLPPGVSDDGFLAGLAGGFVAAAADWLSKFQWVSVVKPVLIGQPFWRMGRPLQSEDDEETCPGFSSSYICGQVSHWFFGFQITRNTLFGPYRSNQSILRVVHLFFYVFGTLPLLYFNTYILIIIYLIIFFILYFSLSSLSSVQYVGTYVHTSFLCSYLWRYHLQ